VTAPVNRSRTCHPEERSDEGSGTLRVRTASGEAVPLRNEPDPWSLRSGRQRSFVQDVTLMATLWRTSLDTNLLSQRFSANRHHGEIVSSRDASAATARERGEQVPAEAERL